MSQEVLTSTEFEQALNNFLNSLDTNIYSKTALLSLQKTFQSRNITIQDWNTLISFINNNLENIGSLCTLLTALCRHNITDIKRIEDLEEDVSSLETNLQTVTNNLTLLSTTVLNISNNMVTIEATEYTIPEEDR